MAFRIYRDIAAQLAAQLHSDPSVYADMVDSDCEMQPIEWFITFQKQLSRIIPDRGGVRAQEFHSAMEDVAKLALRAIHAIEMNGGAQSIVDWVKSEGGSIDDGSI